MRIVCAVKLVFFLFTVVLLIEDIVYLAHLPALTRTAGTNVFTSDGFLGERVPSAPTAFQDKTMLRSTHLLYLLSTGTHILNLPFIFYTYTYYHPDAYR